MRYILPLTKFQKGLTVELICWRTLSLGDLNNAPGYTLHDKHFTAETIKVICTSRVRNTFLRLMSTEIICFNWVDSLLTESYITLTERRDCDLYYFYNPRRIIGWYRFHFMFIDEIVEIILDLIFTCHVLMPEFSCFVKKKKRVKFLK